MDDPIEIEPSAGLGIRPDDRRQMPEPPPVWLHSVADVRVPAATTRVELLDAFYVDLLRFVRLEGEPLTYRAANYDLIFDVELPPIERDGIGPTRVIVPSLYVLRKELASREIVYDYSRGLDPGVVFVVLQDPAGNWLEITDARPIA